MNTRILLVCALLVPFMAWGQSGDSQIFIEQVGNQLTLSINQAGQNNRIGDMSNNNPFMLNGLQQLIEINQLGSGNELLGQIYGDSVQAFLNFVGDNNSMLFNINPDGFNSADSGQFIFDVVGSSNEFTVNLGDIAVADNAFMNWDITGDFNIFNTSINSDNYSSILTVFGNYNDFTITASGASGHSVEIDHRGDYANFVISQTATLESNTIKLQTTTSGTAITPATICISQSDTGTTSC